jgi:hypothetical protein
MFSQFSFEDDEGNTHARRQTDRQTDRQRIRHEQTNSFVFFVRWMTLSKFHRESVYAHHSIIEYVFPF